MKKIHFTTLIVCFLCTNLHSAAASDAQLHEWQKLLNQQEKNYPGCVMVVRDQLAQVPDDQYAELTPILLDTCITGREIGEKRTRQMYEIPKGTKPRKLGGFTIKVEPPGAGRDDEWDVRYR